VGLRRLSGTYFKSLAPATNFVKRRTCEGWSQDHGHQTQQSEKRKKKKMLQALMTNTSMIREMKLRKVQLKVQAARNFLNAKNNDLRPDIQIKLPPTRKDGASRGL